MALGSKPMYKDVRIKIHFRKWLKCKLGNGSIGTVDVCLQIIVFKEIVNNPVAELLRRKPQGRLTDHFFYGVVGGDSNDMFS